jgi:hypothetical protein
MLAAIVDECQRNAYCKAMPSVCGACGRRCRCACRHRRKLCIVLQHVDNSLAVDNAMRVAQASMLMAQFGVSFDPFGGAKSRVTVSAYSAPRLAEARQRLARAALGACCHRCVGSAHVLDDRFGRRRRLGRAVVRRSAPDARAGVARQHVALHSDVRKRHCRTSSMRASSTRERWSIRSLICSLQTAPELEKERDARVAGALHTLTLLAGMPDIMLPTQRLQLLTMVCTHGAKFDRLQSQARLSALVSSLATCYDSYTHPRVSDADLGAAIDQCLAVAQAADAHWRYRILASVVLMMYALPRSRRNRARASWRTLRAAPSVRCGSCA